MVLSDLLLILSVVVAILAILLPVNDRDGR